MSPGEGERETYEEFAARFRDYFSLGHTPLPDESLAADLGFDSLALFEIVALLDEMADHPVPDEVVADLVDMADVYHYFSSFSPS